MDPHRRCGRDLVFRCHPNQIIVLIKKEVTSKSYDFWVSLSYKSLKALGVKPVFFLNNFVKYSDVSKWRI